CKLTVSSGHPAYFEHATASRTTGIGRVSAVSSSADVPDQHRRKRLGEATIFEERGTLVDRRADDRGRAPGEQERRDLEVDGRLVATLGQDAAHPLDRTQRIALRAARCSGECVLPVEALEELRRERSQLALPL